MESGKVLSASVVKEGGAAASVCKAFHGNGFGFLFTKELTNKELFAPLAGSLVLELADGAQLGSDVLYYDLGTVTDDGRITMGGKSVDIKTVAESWQAPLEKVFPTQAECPKVEVDAPLCTERNTTLYSTLPYHYLSAIPSFGYMLSPVKFSAQDHSTSELLRTL